MKTPGPIPQATAGRFAAKGAWDRFRTYLIGFGIGAVLAGMFLALKYQAAQKEAAENQAAPAMKP